MPAVTPAIHLLIAVSMAAPSSAPSDCAADDVQCSARAFTSAARHAKSNVERVEYLYFASRSFLALSAKPPRSPSSSRDLCRANQLIEQAVTLPATELRERVIKSRQETRARLRTENVRCSPPKPRAKDNQSRIALAGPRAAEVSPQTPSQQVVNQRAPVAAAPEAQALERTRGSSPGMPEGTPPDAADPRATIASASAPASTLLRAVVAAEPTPGLAVERPPSAPPIRPVPQRSRAQVGVSIGLVTVGTGLLVGTAAAFVGRHGYNEKIAVLRGEQENRDLTTQEVADISSWDARYLQLERTGAVLGGLAAASFVTAVVVFLMPKQRAAAQARVRPVGAGVHINF